MILAGLHGLALALTGAGIAAAFGAVTARSLFAVTCYLVAAAASVAGALLLLGAGDGALALALLAAGWAPVLLMATMLLSSRSAKAVKRRWWLSGAAALAVSGALWASLGDLGEQAALNSGAPPTVAFWLAPLMLVVAAACAGLLGFGERGALERANPEQNS